MIDPNSQEGDGYFGRPSEPESVPCPADTPAAAVPLPAQRPSGDSRDFLTAQLAVQTEPAPGQQCPLSRDLGDAEELVRSVGQRLTASLSSHVDECQSITDRCQGSCHGQLCAALDQVDAVCDKVCRRIDTDLVTMLATAYNTCARFGIAQPTDDELVAFAVQTGRLPASMLPARVGQTGQAFPGEPANLPGEPSPPPQGPERVRGLADFLQLPKPPIGQIPNDAVPDAPGERVAAVEGMLPGDRLPQVAPPGGRLAGLGGAGAALEAERPKVDEKAAAEEKAAAAAAAEQRKQGAADKQAAAVAAGGGFPAFCNPLDCPDPAKLEKAGAAVSEALGEVLPDLFISVHEWIRGLVPNNVKKFMGWSTEPIKRGEATAVGKFLGGIVGFILKGIGAGNEGLGAPIATSGFLAWTSRILGVDLSAQQRVVGQWIGTVYQTQIPTAESADVAFLTGNISQEEWVCLSKLNGRCMPWAERERNSKRSRLTASEYWSAAMRGVIEPEAADNAMRSLGMTDQADRELVGELAKYVPNPADMVPWMVRDAFDEEVVKKYGYDDGFKEKFTGPVRAWAAAQGMTPDIFKYFWRSHWQLPSPTQAYEMLHRLRPGKVSGDLAVDKSDIAELLEINDYAPTWQDRLIAISYAPLTRVDTQRAFFIGTLNRIEVKESYLDLGYDSENAERLTRFTEQLKARWVRGQLGLPTPAAYAGQFRKGLIGQGAFRDKLFELGWSGEVVNGAIRDVKEQRQQDLLVSRIRAVKKRYMIGDAAAADALPALTEAGMDGEAATALFREWDFELRIKGKAVPAAQLCKMASAGLISREDYKNRLGFLGYSEPDSARMAYLCESALAQKQAKAAEAAARQAQKMAEKRVADIRALFRKLLDEAKIVQSDFDKYMKELDAWEKEYAKKLEKSGGAAPKPSKAKGSSNGATNGTAAANGSASVSGGSAVPVAGEALGGSASDSGGALESLSPQETEALGILAELDKAGLGAALAALRVIRQQSAGATAPEPVQMAAP